MKYPQSVPLWRTNEELLAGQFFSQVVLSVGTRWNEVVLEQQSRTIQKSRLKCGAIRICTAYVAENRCIEKLG